MQCELPVTSGDDPEVLAAMLWRAGAQGVWVQPDRVVGYFATAIADAEVPADATWGSVPDVDWASTWREGIEPVEAGPFDVVPTWLAADHPQRPGRHRVVLDPGRAFGSGHHDTTLGCLEALATLDLDGRSVLDVGTGTGILAIAAAQRGGSPVVGVDLDPHAIAVARANAAANGVTVDLAIGSVSRGSVPPVVGDQRGGFAIVVANLLTQTIVDLAGDLVAVMAPGGRLVTSGIGAPRVDVVVAALRRAGLEGITTRVRGEWAVVQGHRTLRPLA